MKYGHFDNKYNESPKIEDEVIKVEIKGLVFTGNMKFEPAMVTFDKGIIEKVTPVSFDSLSDREKEQKIIPGLVDIHSHGCMGNDTCDSTADGILKMAEFERSVGVTSFFPTTMTLGGEKLTDVVNEVRKAAQKSDVIKGIYLEGPFISREKCGAQNPKFIMKPDAGMIERLKAKSDGLVKFVAVAPEAEGAVECIEKEKDIVFSIAHTNADYDTAMRAMEKGAKHVTHFYNAMKPYNHREPGVIGAAMDRNDVEIELIADGVHVHPAVVRNTFKYFGPGRIILISDSMEATGLSDGEYSLGGQKVFVKGKKATLEDGTIAGSASTLMDCVRTAIGMGVPECEVIEAATKTPAKSAGIFDKVGSIEAGKRADMVVLNSNYEIVRVV